MCINCPILDVSCELIVLVAYYDYVQLFAINSLQSSILRLVYNSFLGLIILFFFLFFSIPNSGRMCSPCSAPNLCTSTVCSSPLRQPRIALKSKCRTRLYTGEKWDNPNTHFIFFCNAPIYTKELTDMKE